MSKIMVHSKCANDIKFNLFEHYKNAAGDTINSRITKTVVVVGLNNFLRENDMRIVHAGRTATTEVDKDTWDAIIADRGAGDQLLINKQIFAAKDDKEAKAMLKDCPKGLSDMKTPEDFKKAMTKRKKLV